MQRQPSGHPAALGPVTHGPQTTPGTAPSTTPRRRAFRRPAAAEEAPDAEVRAKPGVAATASASRTFHFALRPHEIARHLSRFVIGQDEAKMVLSVALCDHFQHVRQTLEGDPARFYQKQNVLLLGPTGVGKTHLVRSAAELIGVPFVKADATKFSETGYVGGDVDDLVRDLVRRANGDVRSAEHGIIYLDEIDKLATREPGAGRDVSGRGVQTNLLKLMEDAEVPLVSPNDVTGQVQNALSAMRGASPAPDTLNTRHILFVVSGAFSGMDRLIRRRLEMERALATPPADPDPVSSRSGRRPATAALPRTVDQYLRLATTTDFVAYGLEPEFIGRLPVRVACHGLDSKDLFNILDRSESSLIHQYRRAFLAYGIDTEFRPEGLQSLARLAAKEGTGARGLMTVCERVFREFKFRLPATRVRRLVVDAALVDDPAGTLRRLLRGRGTR